MTNYRKMQSGNSLLPGMLFGLLGSLMIFSSAAARAQDSDKEIQSVSEISETAIAYALNALESGNYTDISAEARTLDDRLRLHKCSKALEASTNIERVKPGRTSVSIRCNGDTPWSLYVPVTISAYTPVVVLKGPLPRGTVITEHNIEIKNLSVERLPPNYLSDKQDVIGRELTQFVNNESYATAYMLKVKNLIEKGQHVVIKAGSANLEVKMAGVALEPGQFGDRISVQNSTSGLTIQGWVAESGIVAVNL